MAINWEEAGNLRASTVNVLSENSTSTIVRISVRPRGIGPAGIKLRRYGAVPPSTVTVSGEHCVGLLEKVKVKADTTVDDKINRKRRAMANLEAKTARIWNQTREGGFEKVSGLAVACETAVRNKALSRKIGRRDHFQCSWGPTLGECSASRVMGTGNGDFTT